MKRTIDISARLCFACACLFAFAVGCNFYTDDSGRTKHVPAPIPSQLPAQVEGPGFGVWSGNQFQIELGQTAIYCRLLGVQVPAPGQPGCAAARDALRALVVGHSVQATVVATDQWGRCLVTARVNRQDVGLEMIRRGYARYDGAAFDGADRYEQAQRDAQRQKRGLWAESPASPPSG